jgi:hypothetical protein
LYGSTLNPDWFVLLSGSDYPIKKEFKVYNDLISGNYDAYINGELISASEPFDDWKKTCFERYCHKRIVLPHKKKSKNKPRILIIRNSIINKFLIPFTKNFFCYSGWQFFSANRKSAQYIIDYHKTKKNLSLHYATCPHPEESYFQTILLNSNEIKVSNQSWRYIDWSAGGSHPKILTCADLLQIYESDAHFARKFNTEIDSKVFDEIDANLLS